MRRKFGGERRRVSASFCRAEVVGRRENGQPGKLSASGPCVRVGAAGCALPEKSTVKEDRSANEKKNLPDCRMKRSGRGNTSLRTCKPLNGERPRDGEFNVLPGNDPIR